MDDDASGAFCGLMLEKKMQGCFQKCCRDGISGRREFADKNQRKLKW
jgi:hypothetical protein